MIDFSLSEPARVRTDVAVALAAHKRMKHNKV